MSPAFSISCLVSANCILISLGPPGPTSGSDEPGGIIPPGPTSGSDESGGIIPPMVL